MVRKLKPILGFTPNHVHLFKMAFYHRSMNQEDSGTSYNNERLEFLGDSVLNAIVAEYLFKKYPNKDEGFLTKMRSKIVKRNTLNDIADNMGLDMILSEYSIGKMSSSMMGNALEALVGAIYIEFGYDKTSEYVIKKILMNYLDIHMLELKDDNFKSILLEWCQKNNKEVNVVDLINEQFGKCINDFKWTEECVKCKFISPHIKTEKLTSLGKKCLLTKVSKNLIEQFSGKLKFLRN